MQTLIERPAGLLHLVWKDWRFIRGWAASCWILTGAAWIVLHLDPELERMGTQGALTYLVQLVLLVIPGIAFARLLQVDPVLVTTSFSSTLPIRRTQQLSSKLIVGFGTLVAPCLLIAVVPVALRGLAATTEEYVLAAVSTLLRYLLVVWLALVVATLARGTAAVALLAATIGVLALFLQVYLFNWLFSGGPERQSFAWVLPWLLLSQSIAYLYVLYRSRRPAWAAATWIAGLAAIAGVRSQWGWDLVNRPLPARAGPDAGGVDGPVRLIPETGSRAWRTGRLEMRIEGLPPGVSLSQVGYDVEVSMSDGEVRTLKARTTPLVWAPSHVAAALGCSRDTPPILDVQLLPTEEALRLKRTQRIERITGRVSLTAVRTIVSARTSLADARLAFPGVRLRGSDVTPSGEVLLRFETLNVWPRPSALERMGDPHFLHPATGDCFAYEESGHSASPGWGPLPLEAGASFYSGWRRDSGSRHRGIHAERALRSLPAQTEIAFLEYATLGMVEVPVEYSPPDASSLNAKLQ